MNTSSSVASLPGRQNAATTASTIPEAEAPSPKVLRCNSTADFLAALPFLTGFTDENSMFVVLFQGKRAGNVLRIDMPSDESSRASEQLLDGLIHILDETGSGAEGPAIVFHTSQSFAESQGAPWARFGKRLRRRFSREGWTLRELAVVAPDGWAGLLGDRPGEKHPLSEISESPTAVEATAIVAAEAEEAAGWSADEAAGWSADEATDWGAASRDGRGDPAALKGSEGSSGRRGQGSGPQPRHLLGQLPEAEASRSEEVARHLDELERRRQARSAHPAGDSHRSQSTAWMHGTARVAGACFDGFGTAKHGRSAPDARLVARLIESAQSPEKWLVLALTALTRVEFITDLADDCESIRFTDLPIDIDADDSAPSGPGWSIRRLLHSLAYESPEPQKLRAAIAAAMSAATHAPRDQRPGLLALIAWAWWMLGMQSVCADFVKQSLQIDASHELTLMVSRLSEAPPPSRILDLRRQFAAQKGRRFAA